jgi:hypothetical protein
MLSSMDRLGLQCWLKQMFLLLLSDSSSHNNYYSFLLEIESGNTSKFYAFVYESYYPIDPLIVHQKCWVFPPSTSQVTFGIVTCRPVTR